MEGRRKADVPLGHGEREPDQPRADARQIGLDVGFADWLTGEFPISGLTVAAELGNPADYDRSFFKTLGNPVFRLQCDYLYLLGHTRAPPDVNALERLDLGPLTAIAQGKRNNRHGRPAVDFRRPVLLESDLFEASVDDFSLGLIVALQEVLAALPNDQASMYLAFGHDSPWGPIDFAYLLFHAGEPPSYEFRYNLGLQPRLAFKYWGSFPYFDLPEAQDFFGS